MTSERKGCLKGLVIVCAGILALSVAFATTGEAASYTFVKIAEFQDGGQFSFFPSLNNDGMVAFSTASAIFIGNGGPLETVAETGGEFSSFGRPSIGDGDQVAFKAYRQGSWFVVRRNGATLTTIAESEDGFSDYQGVSIDNSGRVAFQGRYPLGIFTGDGGALTQIAVSSTSLKIPWGVTPVIDDRGKVVFQASNTSGPGIFTGNGGVPLVTVKSVLDPPSVSDSGIVAFKGVLSTGEQGIFKHDGLGLTTVADTDVFSNVSWASVNDEGVVAFRGTPRSTGKAGIFTGPDPEKDKVIAAGDALFGSTVGLVAFGWEGLNNAGQVAFYARLADGTMGIYRADPVPDEIPVIVDVKPGDNPNVINRDSHGVVPVAILSTENFDATTVDPTTITLANAPVKMKKNGKPMVAFEDVNEDGLVDLLFHVSTQDLQLEESDSEVVLDLEAQTLQTLQALDGTLDGTPVKKVKGSDSVRVVH